jgi:hypothetical protein
MSLALHLQSHVSFHCLVAVELRSSKKNGEQKKEKRRALFCCFVLGRQKSVSPLKGKVGSDAGKVGKGKGEDEEEKKRLGL